MGWNEISITTLFLCYLRLTPPRGAILWRPADPIEEDRAMSKMTGATGEIPGTPESAAAPSAAALVDAASAPAGPTIGGTSVKLGAPDPERPHVGAKYIWFLVLAYLGGTVALVAPLGISLSLRVQELVPQNVEVLGYVVGVGAAVAGISQPLIGMWSDRTRSRFGRRRPFSFGGAIFGVLGLAVMAAAPDIWILTLGWIITQLGWGTANGAILLSQADRLPEAQRGKVAGLSGFTLMIGSVLGVGIASAFIGNKFLVFLVPGLIGLFFALLWVVFVKEEDSRGLVVGERLTLRNALVGMVFNPTQHQDFAWNWLARLFFNFGVSFATTFTTLFFASRLSQSGLVADIGPLIAVLSLTGVVATAGGALLGGTLSDKLKKRRLFVLLSGIAFTAGALTMAFGGSNAGLLIAGSVLTSAGLGVFSAVDQAIVLDILPERENEAGRYIGINGYSTSIAQAAAPVVGAPLLLLGVSGADRNYGLLFIIAAVCTLVGGVLVTWKVRGTK
jgi:MFS family permease